MSEYIVRETGFPGTIKQEIVQELVRCKGCRHAQEDKLFGGYWCEGTQRQGDWFCPNGERRDDDTD